MRIDERHAGTRGTIWLDDPPANLRVLRICSVFEPPVNTVRDGATRFDPIGGMQNHTGELTRRLSARGLEQTIVTTRPPGTPSRQRFAPGAEVIRLGWNVPRLRQLYSVAAVPLLPRLGAKADLVHVHLGEDLAVIPLGRLAAQTNDLPLVITVHCSPRHTVEAKDLRTKVLTGLGGRIEHAGEQMADAVIVISWRMAEKLLTDGISASKLHVIPSGVDPDIFAGPFADPLPHIRRPRISLVGRITRAKGIFELLEAAEMLTHECQIVFVGDGPDRAELERLIVNRGLTGKVVVTGFVPHFEVPAYLAHTDVLTLPSHYEELGSVLLEGMQSGLAMVATDTGGIPEIINDGHTGLLVPPREPRALASALDSLLWNAGLRRSLGDNAARRAPLYDWDELALRIHDVYTTVLAQHEGPA